MKFYLLFITLFSTSLFADVQYQSCELVDRYDLFFHRRNLIDSCEGHKLPKFIHGKTYVKNPVMEILVSSYRTDNQEPLDIKIKLNLAEECKTLSCFQNLDLKEIISENESYQKIVKAQIQEQVGDIDLNDKSISLSAVVKNVEIHPASPLFNSPPDPDSRLEIAIFGDIYGMLDPEQEEMAYEETPLPENEVEDFEWEEVFTPEEIAQWEQEAIEEDEVDSAPPIVGEPESGESLGIQDSSDDFEEVQVGDTTIISIPTDVKQDESETEILPEPFEINTPKERWQVTPTGKREDAYEFQLTSGDQKYQVSSNELEMLSGYADLIEEVRVDNNTVYYNITGFDEVMQLSGSVQVTEDPEAEKHVEMPAPESEEEVVQTGTDINNCINTLSDYVSSGEYDDILTEFMAIQGKLTLHRLAWAQLGTSTPKEKLEDNILKLIKEKYADKYEKLASEFDTVPKRSRNFLARAIPIVKDILNEQEKMNETNKVPYLINTGDLKMLEIIADFEKTHKRKICR